MMMSNIIDLRLCKDPTACPTLISLISVPFITISNAPALKRTYYIHCTIAHITASRLITTNDSPMLLLLLLVPPLYYTSIRSLTATAHVMYVWHVSMVPATRYAHHSIDDVTVTRYLID